LRYKASASCRVNEVELEKKSGLKSIPLKDGLGAVLISAIYFYMIFKPSRFIGVRGARPSGLDNLNIVIGWIFSCYASDPSKKEHGILHTDRRRLQR
jgi:hypothetical protein